MDRRRFLQLSLAAGAGAAIPHGLEHLVTLADAAGYPDIVAATGVSPAAITKAAIDGLGGIGRFISRGDIVVVKPNIAWDRLPEQAATTNPEVLSTVVRLCFEAGAKKVRVFDRPVNDPRRCYVQSGITKALAPLGADLFYVDDRKFRDKQINGEVLKSWPLYTEIFEADKVINVPIAKHHGLAKITMSMKNWMGIMGGTRNQIHQRLDQSLADLGLVIKPTLTILDAVRILVANGPQGGSLSDVRKLDTVIAGVNQVTIDSYGATLFGMKGSDLGSVRAAAKMGLGSMDLSRVSIKKIKV